MTAKTSINILHLNGPNLNLLGTREPHIYGSTTLKDIQTRLDELAIQSTSAAKIFISHHQSNHEGYLIDLIHSSSSRTSSFVSPPPASTVSSPLPEIDGIIINAGGLTHTSVALRDALVSVGIPFVEVHVSNVYAREEFRHRSLLSDKAKAVVAGMGGFGYEAAFEFLVRLLTEEKKG